MNGYLEFTYHALRPIRVQNSNYTFVNLIVKNIEYFECVS